MMPQLEINSFVSQIFWLSVSFYLLYLFLKKKIIPNFESSLKLRDKTIKSLRKEAEELSAESELIEDKCRDLLRKAHIEADQVKKDALLSFQKKSHGELLALKDRYDLEYQALQLEISKLKEEILDKDTLDKYAELITKKVVCWTKVSG